MPGVRSGVGRADSVGVSRSHCRFHCARQAGFGGRVWQARLVDGRHALTIRPVRRSTLGCRARLKFLSADTDLELAHHARDCVAEERLV